MIRNKRAVLGTGSSRPTCVEVLSPVVLQLWAKTTDSEQLALSMCKQRRQLEEFFNQARIEPALFLTTTLAIGRVAILQPQRDSVKLLLESCCKCRFFSHINDQLTEMQITGEWNEAEEFLRSCLAILEQALNLVPRYTSVYLPTVSSLQSAITSLHSFRENQALLDGIVNLSRRTKNVLLEERKRDVLSQGRVFLSSGCQEPPENFRNISVLPTEEDIREDAYHFVRCAKIEGSYKDLEDYLDVQFRLMRQDFIHPLRQGIADFKRAGCKGNGKTNELRFYFGVHILGTFFTVSDNGIHHVLKFDVSRLKNIDWNHSNRLMFGSLLCLSKDNFQSMLFATVSNADATNKENGLIMVSLKANSRDTYFISKQDVFVMAETTAYYESYIHVLDGLQEISGSLPLQDYIVYCKNVVKPPMYLLPSGGRTSVPVYNISCLMKDLKPCHVPVLTTVKWPPAEVMCLNESQRQAAQTALTKSLAIIQGPPGTGKTYVGLKVLQVLLANSTNMDKNSTEVQLPILVVCYTNHALDQVLEGLLNFHEYGVVRIGGRSKSTRLEPFNLKALKKHKDHRNCESNKAMNISQKLNYIEKISESLDKNTTSYTNLIPFINEAHKRTLLTTKSSNLESNNTLNVWLNNRHGGLEKKVEEDIREHLVKLVINHKWPSKRGSGFGKYMNIHQRARFYVDCLKKYRIHFSIMHSGCAVENLETRILSDEELEHVIGSEILYDMKCELETLNPTLTLAQGRTMEFWLLRPYRSVHQILDDIEALTSSNREGRQTLTNMKWTNDEFHKIQNDRMLDKDIAQIELFRDRLREAQNNLHSIMQRARSLGVTGGAINENAEWTTNMKKKGLDLLQIQKKLKEIQPMEEDLEKKVVNVWNLTLDQRFSLYNLWVQRYREHLSHITDNLMFRYENLQLESRKEDEKETLRVLRTRHVIGMTTTGAARYRRVLRELGCTIVLVEEAAEVLESHIVTSLNKNCQHLILIGDHQQLRPSPTVYQLAKDFGLDVSLFERLLKNKVEHVMLRQQHRMRPEIANFMRHIYPNLQDHPSVEQYENIRGVSKNIFFVTHEHQESDFDDTKSKSNIHEAKYVVSLCRYLLNQDYLSSQITILATYTGQVLEIKKIMDKYNLRNVLVTAVDNYQGEENDIIILSMVRSNVENRVGFLKVDNRVCVALSRAKKGLFVIGNFHLLETQSKLWKKIVGTARQEQVIGSGLPVHCQNHVSKMELLSCKKDFKKCPEGGCGGPCETRLDCGHMCGLSCHGYDRQHQRYKCQKPCTKSCLSDHPCQLRCYEVCFCSVLVVKTMPECGHDNEIQCSASVNQRDCSHPCTHILQCQHQCSGKCGSCWNTKNHQRCDVEVDYTWPCGHQKMVPCHESLLPCPFPCRVLMECQHQCSGICGTCKRDNKHSPCQSPVTLQRRCGHEVRLKCWKVPTIPPCTQPCSKQLSCQHTCPGVCGVCLEQDQHAKCRVPATHTRPCGHIVHDLCGNIPPSQPCTEVCGQQLECQHMCSGVCAECSINKQHEDCYKQVPYQRPCQHMDIVQCWELPEPELDSCQEDCRQTIKCGHLCSGKCGKCDINQKHEACNEQVPYQRPCKHIEIVKCQTLPEPKLEPCQEACEKTLDCGHMCSGICGKCDINQQHEACNEQVSYERSCQHIDSVECWTLPEPRLKPCQQTCKKTLECDHLCSGICSTCAKEGHHEACAELVSYLRSCGHLEKVECCISENPSLNPCTNPCGKEMGCGHLCIAMCGRCTNIGRHGLCTLKVQRTRSCGHTEQVKCCQSSRSSSDLCLQVCGKSLPCSHPCRGICSECTIKARHSDCMVKVEALRPCGHKGDLVLCSKKDEPPDLSCRDVCSAKLNCGHVCRAKCADCVFGAVHQVCSEKCGRELPCGHICDSFCGVPCPPCRQVCLSECPHDSCRATRSFPPMCGHTCTPCMEPCSYGCLHAKCRRRCSEPCDVAPCRKRCTKKLARCKHKCTGLCGELCVCRCLPVFEIHIPAGGNNTIDNTSSTTGVTTREESIRENSPSGDTTTTMVSKTGSERSTNLLLQLPSCGHVFHLDQLDRYMSEVYLSGTANVPCPACKQPITYCMRYNEQLQQRRKRLDRDKLRLSKAVSFTQKHKDQLKKSISMMKSSSLMKPFHNLVTTVVTNNLELEEVSFKIKYAFLLSASSAVIQISGADFTDHFKMLCQAVTKSNRRMSQQQISEFKTELSRVFWRACLICLQNFLGSANTPVSPNPTEIQTLIQTLGNVKPDMDCLIKAEHFTNTLLSNNKKPLPTLDSRVGHSLEKLEMITKLVTRFLQATDDHMLCDLVPQGEEIDTVLALHV